MDTYNRIIDSITDIADTWAAEDNREPDDDAIIIIAKFSSRIEAPVLRQTANEYKKTGKQGLKEKLTKIVYLGGDSSSSDWGSQEKFEKMSALKSTPMYFNIFLTFGFF